MTAINETELKKHIKSKQFVPVYLIYGSEQMFVSRYTQKLVEAVAGKNPPDFNFHKFSGQIDLDKLAAAVQIVPFMCEHNCVVVTDIFYDMLKPSELDDLKAIVKNSSEDTVLIISMPTYIPKKQAKQFQTLAKTIEKIGAVCKFEKLNQTMLERYIAKWANENDKLISHINAAKLIAYSGEDLNVLKNEVDKLCAYAQGEEITLEDIDKLATVNNVEMKIYAMTDAVLKNDGEKAFATLNLLINQGEKPMLIFSALSSTYVDAYRARVADECGVLQSTLVADFKAYQSKAFVLKNARNATRRVSTEALRKSLDVLVEADTTMKTSMKDIKNTFQPFMEKLIARLLLIAREGRV